MLGTEGQVSGLIASDAQGRSRMIHARPALSSPPAPLAWRDVARAICPGPRRHAHGYRGSRKGTARGATRGGGGAWLSAPTDQGAFWVPALHLHAP